MDTVGKPWNVVIITADDLGADSTGWMGSKVGATPNIDAFAAASYQFQHCHVVSPLCQPSRSALMTGRVPHRNGALGFNPVRPDVTTLTELMRSHDYFTAVINKAAHMMPPQKFDWDLVLQGSGKNPAALGEHFKQCLKAAAESGKSFFINANSTDPHGPFPGGETLGAIQERGPNKQAESGESVATPARIFNESEIVVPSFLENLPAVRTEMAQYFSAVGRLDQAFGEVMTALKASGRFDDTLVIFLSDHGMSMPYSKATLYRSATWSPVLLRWPGLDRPGANMDMVASVDIMPTLLDLLGWQKPDGLDGNSWLPRLHGERPGGHDPVFTQVDAISSGKNYPSRCVRTRTRAYIWNAWSDGRNRFGIGTTQTRLSWIAMVEAAASDAKIKQRVDHFVYRSAEEFYDEEKDPDERNNLIDDPQYQSEIAQMKELLLEQMNKTGDPLAGQFRDVSKGRGHAFWKRVRSFWRG